MFSWILKAFWGVSLQRRISKDFLYMENVLEMFHKPKIPSPKLFGVSHAKAFYNWNTFCKPCLHSRPSGDILYSEDFLEVKRRPFGDHLFREEVLVFLKLECNVTKRLRTYIQVLPKNSNNIQPQLNSNHLNYGKRFKYLIC